MDLDKIAEAYIIWMILICSLSLILGLPWEWQKLIRCDARLIPGGTEWCHMCCHLAPGRLVKIATWRKNIQKLQRKMIGKVQPALFFWSILAMQCFSFAPLITRAAVHICVPLVAVFPTVLNNTRNLIQKLLTF